MISFRISKDTATPRLAALLAKGRGGMQQVYADAGREMAVQLDAHLRRLQARGNVMGWPPRKFFHGGPKSVANNVKITKLSQRGVTVTIDDYRFAHRIKGGPVFPKRAKALAIPLTARAYHTDGPLRVTWPGLVLRRGLLLFQGVAQFVLKRSVTHRPKPNEMPQRMAYLPKLLKAVNQSVRGWLK